MKKIIMIVVIASMAPVLAQGKKGNRDNKQSSARSVTRKKRCQRSTCMQSDCSAACEILASQKAATATAPASASSIIPGTVRPEFKPGSQGGIVPSPLDSPIMNPSVP